MRPGEWYCSLDMFVQGQGVGFKVASEFNEASMLNAAKSCYESGEVFVRFGFVDKGEVNMPYPDENWFRNKYGDSEEVVVCWDCGKPIIASDDDAHVCIQCGGRNRRKP